MPAIFIVVVAGGSFRLPLRRARVPEPEMMAPWNLPGGITNVSFSLASVVCALTVAANLNDSLAPAGWDTAIAVPDIPASSRTMAVTRALCLMSFASVSGSTRNHEHHAHADPSANLQPAV